MVIDFHSHILPGIDDGSTDVETTEEMLAQATAQGVDVVVATPHFYADEDSLDGFLERRAAAYGKACGCLAGPQLLLGSEVAYFPGISRAKDIGRLAIMRPHSEPVLYRGQPILMIEMPHRKWRSHEVEEIGELIENRGFAVILAHVDHYMERENKSALEKMLELPVICQINCTAVIGGKRKLFKADVPYILGSDTHGTTARPQLLGAAREKIEPELLRKIDLFGSVLLGLG